MMKQNWLTECLVYQYGKDMKKIIKIFICFCISLLTSCEVNDNIELDKYVYIQSENNQQDIRITFSEELSFVFNAYKFNLDTKQWELFLLTKDGLSWGKDSYIVLFNPLTRDDGICLEMKYQPGNIEKYGYDNVFYENVISTETNFIWIFVENIVFEENSEIPIAFGCFLENDEDKLIGFDSSLIKNTSQIKNNMIMFTIKT